MDREREVGWSYRYNVCKYVCVGWMVEMICTYVYDTTSNFQPQPYICTDTTSYRQRQKGKDKNLHHQIYESERHEILSKQARESKLKGEVRGQGGRVGEEGG